MNASILKDIKATHNATEAPIQILLKLTMMAFGILPLPGTEKSSVKNRFDIEIDLTWFPIVTTCLSIVGVLFGTLWIVDPIVKETHWINKLAYLPIFFYRMLVWLLILIILEKFSAIPFVCFAIINILILFFAQKNLDIDPICHALLSLIFPIYKLPSQNLGDNESKKGMKILFYMITIGNTTLLIFHVSVYYLYRHNVYNPWSSGHTNKLLVHEDMFKDILPSIITLYVAATLPTVLCYIFQRQR